MKVKNSKKLVSIAIAVIMMFSAMAVEAQEQEQAPTLRLYGETNAIYPTQSYTGAIDFIYPDPVDPFDPGIISKDSITLNPAYISPIYEEAEDPDAAITVDRADSGEKVLFRAFYEPGYCHPADDIMSNYCALHPFNNNVPVDAIITETTYMLVDKNRKPITGHHGTPKFTHFMLPVRSLTETTPGMEDGDMVDLVFADDIGTVRLTDGLIAVQHTRINVTKGEWVNFMDHMIRFDCLSTDDVPLMDVEYVGNQISERDETKPYINAPMEVGTIYYFDRSNTNIPEVAPVDDFSESTPQYRWYAMVDEIRDETHVNLVVGRVLAAGETFYVDGVRYDMPAIYVDGDAGFKYITFQTPIPKDLVEADGYTDTEDWTHVTSQWLANLDMKDGVGADDNIWVLPPFNHDHTMIDDIGLIKVETAVNDWEVPEYGLIIAGDKNSLEFYYTAEREEERFNTSLAERLYVDGDEEWDWWSVYTKPINYTEFVLPNQETTSDTYDSEDPAAKTWYTYDADGYEYLLTSSFIAPNCDAADRHTQSKATVDVHDIVDRANTIANQGDTSRYEYRNDPRVAFEYDAVSLTDIYVNENNLLRVYGDDVDAGYPTHSGRATDYVYPSENDPFDPGIISKDSITFNPAYMSPRYYPHAEAEDDAITIDGADAGEKVFYRLFYEPEYYHPIDTKMSDFYELENFNQGTPVDAAITETTYMFVNSARDPREGGPKPSDTHFMLPVRSLLEDPPGMEDGDMVDLANASCDPARLTKGTIAVEQKLTDVPKNQWVYFMDHKIKFTGLDIHQNPTFSVGYVGNKVSARDEEKVKSGIVLRGDNVTYFDRSNTELDSGVSKPFTGSDPRYRWYVKVTRIDIDQVHIDLAVGRVLAAGETFYVDAMRYDMPAIYTVELDGTCEFKYITFQTPIPKGEDGTDTRDWSHVTSQWIANLDENVNVWVLPPLNHEHTMIDDIGLIKVETVVNDWEVPEAGLMIDGDKGALEYYYVDETTEERFNSSLAERLYVDGDEEWDWWSVYTKPINYTEFVLPNQEMITDTYDPEDPVYVENPEYGTWYDTADGYEYLLTSSFIAPNCENQERHVQDDSKSSVEVHDIINTANVPYANAPRVAFEYDAVDDTGIYVNGEYVNGEAGEMCGDVAPYPSGDGKVNMGDVVRLLNHVGNPEEFPVDQWAGDCKCTGTIDMGDVVLLLNHVGNPDEFLLECC